MLILLYFIHMAIIIEKNGTAVVADLIVFNLSK